MQKKRTMTIFITLAMVISLMSLPVSAMDVNMSTIIPLARGNNAQIKLLDYQRGALMTYSERSDAIAALNSQISAIKTDIEQLTTLKGSLDLSDEVVGETNSAIADVIDSTILSLSYNKKSLSDTLDSLEATDYSTQKITLKNNMEQVAFSSFTMLMAYYSMDGQIADLKVTYESLSRKADMAKNMYDLGLATSNDYLNADIAKRQLASKIDSLENSLNSLKVQIASSIDMTADNITITPLETISSGSFDSELTKIDNLSNYDTAAGASYDILIIKNEINEAGYDSLENAYKAQLEDTQRRHEQAFNDMVTDAKNKLSYLKIATDTLNINKNNLVIADLKYNLGLISKMAYEDAQGQIKTDENAYRSACIDYYKAYYKLVQMNQGVWITQ